MEIKWAISILMGLGTGMSEIK